MSKAERDLFYAQDALPFEKYYLDCLDQDEITLPLTKAGFEILLSEACKRFELPVDDGSRSTLAGYIHHIPPDKHTTTIDEIGPILHKAISNAMTWQVDQDAKARGKKEEPTQLSVVGTDVPAPTQGS